MEVASLGARQLDLSIRRLSEEFGMARETIQKRLTEAGVAPSGRRAGHPVYRLRDVCPALFVPTVDADGLIDPAKLKPPDRRAWYQSENERLKFEQEMGQLILAAEVHAEFAAVAKIVVRTLETLPDIVERDLRPGPDVIEYLQRKVAEVRAEIADRIASEDVDDARISA